MGEGDKQKGKGWRSGIKHYSAMLCSILEIVTALIVFVAVLFSLISVFPQLGEVWRMQGDSAGFLHFLEKIFTIVIGIEFMKMLCHPDSDNVLEIMIFLIARHMIITTTTPVEDMISTVSIVLLCLVRQWLKTLKTKEKEKEKEKARDE